MTQRYTEDDIFYPLMFRNGVLLMWAHMQGGGAANFYPPPGHAREISSQFQLVVNVSRDACAWLNTKTDHLTDEAACQYFREQIEACIATTAVDSRRTAFGADVPIMSSMKVVGVTCYPAEKGGVSRNIDAPDKQVATRRFLVHYNGF